MALFGILKMGRLTRLKRIIRLLTATQDMKVLAQLCYMAVFIFIYLHWYACIFWLMVRKQATWVPYFL